MSFHLLDATPHMAYVDRHELLRSMLTEAQFRERRQALLQHSTTVYLGNLSFYTTEQQIIEHVSCCGDVRDLVMGLNEQTRTPCGFCFVVFARHADALRAVQMLHGSILDDRVLRVSWDVGVDETRRWGRGADGGQVVDGVRQNVDDGRGGLGALRRSALGVADAVTLDESEAVAYVWVPPPRRLRGAAAVTQQQQQQQQQRAQRKRRVRDAD